MNLMSGPEDPSSPRGPAGGGELTRAPRQPGFPWWVWILIFLLPDFSMLGYAFNNKTGALVYNLFHHQLTAVLVWFAGFLLQDEVLQLSGLVLLGHSSLDRVMGFGLKTKAGFKFTHLNTQGN